MPLYTRTSLREYALYSDDPNLEQFIAFAQRYSLYYELHLNRTRILVPEGAIHTEFLLRFPGSQRLCEYREYS